VELPTLLVVLSLVFFVAALYSSVGHGGASGYLAVLSFFAVAPSVMSSTALVLNILVAGVALVAYHRAGHLSFRFAWPFIVLSIPAAFVGGWLHVSDQIYHVILAAVLLVAAYRLAMAVTPGENPTESKNPSLVTALSLGGGIGLLSGIVGVGGGIFLSPVVILMRWAETKKTSALSALFIVVNSAAGLGGRFLKGGFEIGEFLPLVFVAFLGGLIGSHYGANRLSGFILRRLLAVVLLIAAVKLTLTTL